MNSQKMRFAVLLLAVGVSGVAQAALQGRDLNGSVGSFEAYYDTVLDITWLADANYAQTSGYDADGNMTWATASTWAANLSFTDGVNVYDNWRLPTADPVNGTSFNYNYSFNGTTDNGYGITSPNNEMSYMYYVNLGGQALYNTAGAMSGCTLFGSSPCLNNSGPFSNLLHYSYFSGSDYKPGSAFVWGYGMGGGATFALSKPTAITLGL